MAAQKDEILFLCKFLRHLLIEYLSLRCQINEPRTVAKLLRKHFICPADRLCLHHHSGSASVRIIIDPSVATHRMFPDIKRCQRQQSFRHRPPDNTRVHALLDHFREKCHHVIVHSLQQMYFHNTVFHVHVQNALTNRRDQDILSIFHPYLVDVIRSCRKHII